MGLTRGRVVSAEGAVRISEVHPEGPFRVRSRAWVEAHEAAQQIETDARLAADDLLKRASREADALRGQALREGQAEAEAAVAAQWLALKQAEERWIQGHEEDLFGVARLLAERLLLRELAVNPGTIVDLARQALMPLRRARQLRFHVHPEDAEPLRQGLASLGLNADRIEVNLDPSAPRGAVHISTEFGAVRAELAPQLDRLLAALRSP